MSCITILISNFGLEIEMCSNAFGYSISIIMIHIYKFDVFDWNAAHHIENVFSDMMLNKNRGSNINFAAILFHCCSESRSTKLQTYNALQNSRLVHKSQRYIYKILATYLWYIFVCYQRTDFPITTIDISIDWIKRVSNE